MSAYPSSIPAISAAPVAPAPGTEREKLATASKQFEAIFVRQMLAAARKTDFDGDLLGGEALNTFRQMQDERFADLAAERGSFGLAKMIETQLGARLVAQSPSRLREGLGLGLLSNLSKQALPRPLPQAGGETKVSDHSGGAA